MQKKPNPLWSFFTSVRLTVVLLAVIAVIAIFGTVIPQQEASHELARKIGPGTALFLRHLQLFDVYHSAWFLIPLALLAANLIACSVRRFPVSLKLYKALPRPDAPAAIEHAPAEVIDSDRAPAEEAARVSALLGNKYGRLQRAETGGNYFLYGERGSFSHFGVYLVHLSILAMIAGAIIGSLYGFEGYIDITEGSQADTVYLKNRMETRPLGFAVRLEKFTMSLYENGMPREYRSDVSFLRDGRAADGGALRVNHPLSFEGINFYQASYGSRPEEATVSINYTGAKTRQVRVRAGEVIQLPGPGRKAQVTRMESDLMEMGPAVKLSVEGPEGETQLWVFQYIDEITKQNPGLFEMAPVLNPGRVPPYVFRLDGMKSRYYSGLQVNRDPGKPLVALGAALMLAGFIVTFLFSRRQIWVRIGPAEGKTRIAVHGKSSRGQGEGGMERELKRFAAAVRKGEN